MNVIITGSTGMVGEGVLLECLNHNEIEKILVINRRSLGMHHPKLIEIIHKDFFNLSLIEDQLIGYNACFFCLGVSSIGISKEEYKHLTYDLTLGFARVLKLHNNDLTFCYVSGAGTDSSEHGRMAWARIKGATENELLRLFRNAYMFRPAFMKATSGQKNLKGWYKMLAWIFPIVRLFYPSGFLTLSEVGKAMINVVKYGSQHRVLEVDHISVLGHKS